ncbi:MAG: energy-coupling factor transporter transmembrane component T [bacterium]
MLQSRDIVQTGEGNSLSSLLDPRTKLIMLFCLAIMVISIDNPLFLLTLFSVPLALYPLARLPAVKYKIVAIIILVGLWGTIFSQALFYQEWPRTVMVTLIPQNFFFLGRLTGGLYLYREGFIYGLIQGLRFSTMTAAGLLLCWTTEPRDILLGSVRMGVPYELSFMLVCAIRFLPILMAEVSTVIEVQKMKGFHPLKIGHLTSAGLNTLTPVLANSIRRAAVLADSVESRAFRAYPTRTYRNELHYRVVDMVLIGLIVSVATGIPAVKVLCGLYHRQIVYLPGLRWLYEVGRYL